MRSLLLMMMLRSKWQQGVSIFAESEKGRTTTDGSLHTLALSRERVAMRRDPSNSLSRCRRQTLLARLRLCHGSLLAWHGTALYQNEITPHTSHTATSFSSPAKIILIHSDIANYTRQPSTTPPPPTTHQQQQQWELSSTSKKSKRRSRATFSASFSVSAAGNFAPSMSSTVLLVLLVPTRLVVSDTRLSRVT